MLPRYSKISQTMRISQEEVFGPVAPITVVEKDAEAIKLANNSKFGLGASIWTQDLDKAEKLSRRSGIRYSNCEQCSNI